MKGARLLALAALAALDACNPPHDSSENSFENTAAAPNESESEPGTMWVTAERIDRRTCPSTTCGIVGTLSFREAAKVEEEKGQWARVSRVYDAACSQGRSDFVDKGNARCTEQNGIVDGKFAEWVQSRHLSRTRPADPAATAAADEQLVKESDDFRRYRRQFVKAARTLIDRGDCAAGDLSENGGFVKSVNNRDAPVYFTYCGGFTTANRIYLNAKTGEIYR